MRTTWTALSRSLMVLLALAVVLGTAPTARATGEYDNVIVMVPDGCSASVQTLARWYTGEPLALDAYYAGMLGTYMKDSVITDSAAAATAFASGYKTSDGFVGLGPSPVNVLSTEDMPSTELQYKPIATVLEGAKLQGRATGLVSTSRITHATPAAFASHNITRNDENGIMEHLVYQNLDVVLGGGERHLLPPEAGGRRSDGQNLKGVLLDRGYQYVAGRAGMNQINDGKLWGMFASSHMAADVDRAELAPNEPSIEEMTAKALELLSQDRDGFFLMVEGSQVDWAGHANDPIYFLTDFLAFDEAVEIVLDFAADPANGNTLVVVFPDHNTGGMSLGNHHTDNTYTSVSVESLVEPLQGMRLSGFGVASKIGSDTSAANIKAQVAEWWGLDLTDEDVTGILAYVDAGLPMDYALARYISETYTYIGWTTHGHTGEDVPLWTYATDGNRPTGFFDNTAIAHLVADAFGYSLEAVDNLLFVDAAEMIPGATLSTVDPANPVLRTAHCAMPVSKNILRYEPLDLEIQLPGVIVHTEITGKTHVPMIAAAIVNALEASGATAGNLASVDAEELIERLGLDLTPYQLVSKN